MRFVLECLSQRRKVEDVIEREQAREREREEYKKRATVPAKEKARERERVIAV